MTASPTERHLVWPKERFYWAVLDASRLPRRLGGPGKQLDYLLEPLVPQPLDELHAVYRRLPDQRYLACAVPRAALEDELGPLAVTLRPDGLPSFVEDASTGVSAAELNLLTGDFTPLPLQTARSRRVRHAAVMLAVWFALLFVGFERRIAVAGDDERALAGFESDLFQALALEDAPSGLPPALQIEAELRTLRRSRATDAGPAEADAAIALSRLLHRWPRDVPMQTESIHVATETILVNGDVPSTDEAQSVASALETLEGWTLGHPAVRASGDSVRTMVQLRRREESSP